MCMFSAIVLWLLFIDAFEKSFCMEILFEFYFIDGLGRWSRIILAISSSPSRIELAFSTITINWPLSLLQMCLDPEYGILMEFWDPSHYSDFPPLFLFPKSWWLKILSSVAWIMIVTFSIHTSNNPFGHIRGSV